MKDTSPEITKLQRSIIHNKSMEERANMGIDMTRSVRKIVENSIREKKPNLTDGELTAEVFERYHSQDFTDTEVQFIKEEIVRYKRTEQK